MEKKAQYNKVSLIVGLIWIIAAIAAEYYVYFLIGCAFIICGLRNKKNKDR